MSAKVQKSIERAQAQLAKATEILAAAVSMLGGEVAAPVARKTAAKKAVAAVAETPKRGRKAAVAEVPAKKGAKAAAAPAKKSKKSDEDFGSF